MTEEKTTLEMMMLARIVQGHKNELAAIMSLISGLQGICKEQNMQIQILNEKIDKLSERVEYLEGMREIEKV